MSGPIIDAIKERMGDKDLSERVLDDSPLISSYQEELGRRMPEAGGCCSAAEVAEAMRRDQQKYD